MIYFCRNTGDLYITPQMLIANKSHYWLIICYTQLVISLYKKGEVFNLN